MALTNEDIQQVVNALKADAQGVGELAEATSLENVNSLPAIQTVGEEEQMVQVPISMLAAPAIAAAQIANTAADAANGAATEASQMAETAQQAASIAVEKATLAATAAAEAQEAPAQIDQLRSDLSYLDNALDGVLEYSVDTKNKINVATSIIGKYLNTATGNPDGVSETLNTTDYISVESNTSYCLSSDGVFRNVGRFVCFYDQNKTYLGSQFTVEAVNTFLTPSTAKFTRVTYSTLNSVKIQLEVGTVITEYVPYSTVTQILDGSKLRDASVSGSKIENGAVSFEKLSSEIRSVLEDSVETTSDLRETTDIFTELEEKGGVYGGSYYNQQVFNKDKVQGGTKIKLFITPKNISFNALIYDIDGSVIERFQSTTATIGQTYSFEYTLPNNYDYLKIGGYGEVFLKVVCDTRNLPLIDASVKSNTTILAQHSTSISNLETRTIVDKGQELQIISPITILENKQLIINTGVGVFSDSSMQNVAEFDVRGLAEIVITAQVSTNAIVGYAFVTNNDAPISVGSAYTQGSSVVEHTIAVPVNAEKIRFSYFKVDGILAKALMNVIVPMNEFAKDVLKVAEIANSLVGRDAMSATTATLTNGTLTIADVPIYTKKDCVLSFSAKVTSFSSVEFGLGYGGVRGLHIIIDGTDVTYRTANSQRFKESHNLNIGTFLRCSVFHELKKYVIVISTINGTYFKEFNESQLYYAETYGVPYIYANSGTTLTDVKLSKGGADFKKPVWIFGDSYTSFDVKRWVYHIIDYGFTNFMLCGLAGAVSSQMFEQLQYCLKFGTPKYIVWCLGMNDGSGETPYKTYYEEVKKICNNKGIELILQTIPSTPTTNKSAINTIIRNSGCRYIDVYSAVGSNDSGVWYTGYNDDGTHPTELGAKAIASQFLVDMPEIMQY